MVYLLHIRAVTVQREKELELLIYRRKLWIFWASTWLVREVSAWKRMWSKPSVAALLLLLSVVTDARLFGVTLSASLKQSVSYNNLPLGFKPLGIRGGAVDDSDVDFDDSGEVGSVDEVDEEAVEAPNDKSTTLADSAVKAASKSKAKKTATAKSAVNAGLASTSKKASKKRTSKLRIPYILKACMNPLTLIAMTKAYCASLFNLEYLKKVNCRVIVAVFFLSLLENPSHSFISNYCRNHHKI